ncbi:hypothetical protein D9M69_425170 [compost metagenome]
MGSSWLRAQLAERIGMVDSPLLSDFDFTATCRRWNLVAATPKVLSEMSSAQRAKSLILVQDAFTRYFETPVFVAFIELASRLGFRVLLAPYTPNGKPLQVQGFLGAFAFTARRTARNLRGLADFGVPLVGLDPAMTLVYRQEYTKVPGLDCPRVLLPQEWLVDVVPDGPKASHPKQKFRLLSHCTEKTNAPHSAAIWSQVFAQAGLDLAVQAVGCCGMSGTYGHKARNLETSKAIFAQSWEPALAAEVEPEPLATGYSCRSQTARLSERTLRHPIEALLDYYKG